MRDPECVLDNVGRERETGCYTKLPKATMQLLPDSDKDPEANSVDRASSILLKVAKTFPQDTDKEDDVIVPAVDSTRVLESEGSQSKVSGTSPNLNALRIELSQFLYLYSERMIDLLCNVV